MMGSFSKHHAIHWHQRTSSSGSCNVSVTSRDGFIIICTCCAPGHKKTQSFPKALSPQAASMWDAGEGCSQCNREAPACGSGVPVLSVFLRHTLLQCSCSHRPDACLWKGEKSSSSADVFWGVLSHTCSHRKSKHQKEHPNLPHSPLWLTAESVIT